MDDMFDAGLRAMRRDRAARGGGDLFLLERAFDDCLDRLALIDRRFDEALLIGCPNADWPARLGVHAGRITIVDPGPLFARRAGGTFQASEIDALDGERFDLVVAIGTLDTANRLQATMRAIRTALAGGGLFLGAMSGGETLPLLRRVMAAADRASGQAVPRVHPRIEAAMVAPLLEQAGFVRPVVDIDRVSLAYRSLDRLVGDLRAMAATNILAARSRTPIDRRALAVANREFAAACVNGKATETVEIIHFAAWA